MKKSFPQKLTSLFLFLVLTGGIFFSFVVLEKKVLRQEQFISPLSSLFNTPSPRETALAKIITDTLAGTKGTYGIVIKNFKTGEVYSRNENRVYGPGSLYKIWIMATVFETINERKLQLTDILIQDVSVLNEKFRIASEAAERTEGTIRLSVRDALEQMITVSDNYSALLLSEKVRLAYVNTFLGKNGFQSRVGVTGSDPFTTPSDIALFFEKLYREKLVSSGVSNEMLRLLKNQKKNEKLPRYLPEDIVIAHKTGELGFFSHDAGIVYTPKGDYLIVVLSESDFPQAASERIAELSKAIYTYFTQ